MRRWRSRSSGNGSKFYILFIILHIPLGVLAFQHSFLLTFHAWGVLVIGGAWILLGRRLEPTVLPYWIGYIAASEVLWRLANARVFWEYGKYATIVLLVAYVMRSRFIERRWFAPSVALLYFTLLLPSAVLTVLRSPRVREDLSFNLAGPLSLALCAWLFPQIRLRRHHLQRIGNITVAPSVALATAALYSTWRHQSSLVFSTTSNRLTSGGFGPNQVSAALGMGVMFAFVLTLLARSTRMRILYMGIMLWLLTQALLTFSRGGVLNATLSIALLGSQYIREPRYRRAVVGGFAVLLLVGNFFLIPWLDSFTQGAFWARFTETDMTHREDIMAADLSLFREHPLLGVGPGMAEYLRRGGIGFRTAAHTEFTRLIAEHGFLGILALLLLFRMGITAFRRAHTPLARGLVLAFLGWSLAEMFHSAMRVVSISFLFGLSQIQWHLAEKDTLHPRKSIIIQRKAIVEYM